MSSCFMAVNVATGVSTQNTAGHDRRVIQRSFDSYISMRLVWERRNTRGGMRPATISKLVIGKDLSLSSVAGRDS
jgi:hypothetical protein